MGNGRNCLFWQDCWLGEVPLKIQYDDLYRMVRDPYSTVSECWVNQDWFIDFRRALSSEEFERWTWLYDELQHISLNDSPDAVFWALDKSKSLTTKSLYRFLSNRGMPSRVTGIIWKCKIPLKIKIFLWQIFNNKLQVGFSLIKRGWKGDGKCCVCNVLENVNHLFFECPLARMLWAILKEAFDLESVPRSLHELLESWLHGKGPLPSRLIMFVFAGFAWTLWVSRNKMAIEKVFPNMPSDVVYGALSLLQKWMILLKEDDRWRMSQVKDKVVCWMRSFKTNATMPTDVHEI